MKTGLWEILFAKGGECVEQFYCKTKILTGDAAEILQEMHIEKLLLVTDPYFFEAGVAQRLAAQARQSEIFREVSPDPSVELAAKGTAAVRAFGPDTVVALGGGSAIDCAKAMAYFYEKPVTLVAIPTTSGSGSEVTDFAVLTHGSSKCPLVDPRLRPDVAILDKGLLEKLPKSLIADAGFDVLSHALEACVATGAGAITDALAKEAFCVAFDRLAASYAGDTRVRLSVHSASAMAGMAFTQAGLGLCHALSHSLGGLFHVPHGRLNAILLPAVVEYNAPACGEKYAQMARAAGLGGAADTLAVRNLKNGLCRLRRQLNLPRSLRQAGVDVQQLRYRLPDVVKTALADPCCATNPVPVTEAGVRQILEAVTDHG